ncbi:unnamed protein product, partial [marine sediment metagenome]
SDKFDLSERPLSSGHASRIWRRATEIEETDMHDRDRQDVLLVDAREAARLLAVSPRKLWAMTFEQEPALPFIRSGRLVRYPVADLRAWIDAQKQGGPDR